MRLERAIREGHNYVADCLDIPSPCGLLGKLSLSGTMAMLVVAEISAVIGDVSAGGIDLLARESDWTRMSEHFQRRTVSARNIASLASGA